MVHNAANHPTNVCELNLIRKSGKIFAEQNDVMMRFFRYVAAAVVAVVFSLPSGAQVKTDGKTTDIDKVVRLDKTIHDFGDVTLEQGALKCSFTVKNISEKPVVIYNVVSSCGCTDVKWTREPILPDKTGTITATYSNDEGPYPFDKTLTAYISGVKKPIILRLRGIVHEKKLSLNELYPIHNGSFALRKTSYNLGNLTQGGQRSDATTVANLGTTPINVTFANVTPGLALSVMPNPIPAGSTAKLTYIVTADRSRWGKNLYFATPVVNGKSYKPIDIRAFTKEDFSSLTAEEQSNGAQPAFDYSTFHFDKAKRGTVVTATFSYRNLGGRTFHIFKADSETDDITLPETIKDVEPGETGSFSCKLDTSKLSSGDNEVAIILTTNSPLRPVISLHIAGYIL